MLLASPRKTKSVLKQLLVVAPLLVALFGAWWLLGAEEAPGTAQEQLVLADVRIDIKKAETPEERYLGLSDHTHLPPNSGMLFVYEEPGFYEFTMRDMDFALDIIWLDQNMQVVNIAHEVPPDTYPQTFGTDSVAQYVLEVPAGFSQQHSIEPGVTAQWQ